MIISFFFIKVFSLYTECNVSLGKVLINLSNDIDCYELICNDNMFYNFTKNDTIILSGSTNQNFITIDIDNPINNYKELNFIFNNLFIQLTDDVPLTITGNAIINIIEMIGDNKLVSLNSNTIFVSEKSELFLNNGKICLSSPKTLIEGNCSNVHIHSVTLNSQMNTIKDNSIFYGILSQRISIINSNISMETQYDTIGGNYCIEITIENSYIYSKSEKGSSIGKSGLSLSTKKSEGENYDPIDLFIFNSTVESFSNDGPAVGQKSELGSIQINDSFINASSKGYFCAIGGCKTVNILGSTIFASSYHGAPIGGPGITNLYNTITTNITNCSIKAHSMHEFSMLYNEASAIGGGMSDICHIYINSSSVNATSEGTGAAIGGGNYGVFAIIEISNSDVLAKSTYYTSPGIGGGNIADFNYIKIFKSNVTAFSGLSGAAIGASIMFSGNFIHIEDSFVHAFSDEFGAAIGGARSTTFPININIINSCIYAVAGGQNPSTIPQGAAIGGGCQSISLVTMSFGNLYAFNSNITAISSGYGAAIGGGYSQGIGDIIFINCSVVAVSDLNHSASLFDKKNDLEFQNNPGAGIGTGGSQYYPPGGRLMNANGNISFINCSFIDVYGGSIEKHSDVIGTVKWHSASGIGLGGIRPHTIENSNLSISFINCKNVSVYGGNGFDGHTFPGSAIGGSSLDFNTAFKYLNVENSSIYVKNGRSLINGVKHAAVGFPSLMNDYGEVNIKKNTEFVVDSSDDLNSIAFSLNKLSIEKSCEIVIHSKIDDFLNVPDLDLGQIPIIIFKNISASFDSDERIISIEFYNNEIDYVKFVDIKNYDEILFISLAKEGFYKIYINTALRSKSAENNRRYILGDTINSIYEITPKKETVFKLNEAKFTDLSVKTETPNTIEFKTPEITEKEKVTDTSIIFYPSENENNSKRNKKQHILIFAISLSVFVVILITVIIVLLIVFKKNIKIEKHETNSDKLEREEKMISNQENGNGNVPEHNI